MPEQRPTLRGVLHELWMLLRESFSPKAGRFMPFDAYPSKWRPPMKRRVVVR